MIKSRLQLLMSLALMMLLLSLSQLIQAEDSTDSEVVSAESLLKDFFANTQSLTADFTQITLDTNGQLLDEQESVGVFVLERPNKFRWHAITPSELILIADGEKFWNYDVELEQLIIKPINKTLSESPALLLSGESDVLKAFAIVASFDTTLEIGTLKWVQLVPKDNNSDFSKLSIGFLDNEIRLMEFSTTVGQVIRVELTNVNRNVKLKEALFELTVPDYVDVIGR